VRLSLELPAPLTLAVEYSTPYAIAPSGSLLAVEASDGTLRRLYLRDLRDPDLRRVAGTEGAKQPFFSPDGRWLAFFADRKLVKVSITGGPVLELADVGGNSRGATWTSDGTIVIAPSQTAGLLRVPDRGGAATPLTTLDKARDEYSHRWPDAIPGVPWVLFTVGLEDATFDEGRIEAVSLETGERRVVLTGAGFARYLPNGRLLFVRGGRVYSVGFDPGRLAIRGTPEVILDTVRYDWRNGGSHLAVAGREGTVVYTPGESVSHEYYLSWVDREGRITRAVDTPRRFRDLERAPDGRRIAVVIGTATESDLWTVDANATLSQLTYGVAPYRPTWTPDGKGITVGAHRGKAWQLLTVPADGGAPVVLLEGPNRLYPAAWTPDGRHLLFQESSPTTGWDLHSLEVGAAGKPVGGRKAFAASPFHESTAALSPDGRWIAYESDELDGVVQIYVRSWPDGGHKLRASSGGGRLPAWGPGGELYYWQTGEDSLRVIRTRESDGQLTLSPPDAAWKDDVAAAVLQRVMITVPNGRFGVEPAGSRFLLLEKAVVDRGPSLKSPVVVLGGIGALDRPR
jgi:serine/threonine-protein kinase